MSENLFIYELSNGMTGFSGVEKSEFKKTLKRGIKIIRWEEQIPQINTKDDGMPREKNILRKIYNWFFMPREAEQYE